MKLAREEREGGDPMMSKFFAAIGALLREILPQLIDEWKKPKRTKYVGSDPTVNKKIGDSIVEQSIKNSPEHGGEHES